MLLQFPMFSEGASASGVVHTQPRQRTVAPGKRYRPDWGRGRVGMTCLSADLPSLQFGPMPVQVLLEMQACQGMPVGGLHV